MSENNEILEDSIVDELNNRLRIKACPLEKDFYTSSLLRRRKIEEVEGEIYNQVFDVTDIKIIKNFHKDLILSQEINVNIVGYVNRINKMGKRIFIDLTCDYVIMQCMFVEEVYGDKLQFIIDTLHRGDILWTKGRLIYTQTGMLTINVLESKYYGLCYHHLPDKWHGVKDEDIKQRMRPLLNRFDNRGRDIIGNTEYIINTVRKYFTEKGYREINTPILNHVAAGASAKPFVTKLNALDEKMYLQIAPELSLKRAMLDGSTKVFSIAKCFRNEGLSVRHLPEFTMVEVYTAFIDHLDYVKMMIDLLDIFVRDIFDGNYEITYRGNKINLKNIEYIDYCKMMEQLLNIPVQKWEFEEISKIAMEKWKIEDINLINIIDQIYKKNCLVNFIQPTVLYNYPAVMLPLAKEKNGIAQASQLIIGGIECYKAYNEANDPRRLQLMYDDDIDSDVEEYSRFDSEFYRDVEYGLMPMAGFGCGLERLGAILMDISTQDTILFPLMRKQDFNK